MDNIDLSPEVLERIKALAQKATPGPWEYFLCDGICIGSQAPDEILFETPQEIPTKLTSREKENNAAYIAAAHPGVILAMCEEIERLRDMRLNRVGETAMSMLTEAITAVSDGKLNAEVKLGIECPYCGYESSSIEEAKAHDGTCPKHPAVIRAVRLEKEADWLAQTLANECPVCGSVRHLNYSLNGKELLWIRPTPGDWREAAHKAMEGNNGPVH